MKRIIVYFEAKDEKEAYRAFGAGCYWSGYHENVGFAAEEVEEVPKNEQVVLAARVIELNSEDF